MTSAVEMPKYKCHKEVWALKIDTVSTNPDGMGIIIPKNKKYCAFKVSKDYMDKHVPKNGGYYVVYKGGYRSFSPAKEFEAGYSKIE